MQRDDRMNETDTRIMVRRITTIYRGANRAEEAKPAGNEKGDVVTGAEAELKQLCVESVGVTRNNVSAP